MSLLGELLVKLGVDSAGYVKDMNNAKNTANTFGKDVTKSIDNVAKETKNSALRWTELNSAIMLGRQAIDMAKHAYDAIVTPTIKYAAEVRNLSRVSGESAESTSRLIQVADDMTVSYESLMTAARMAAQKGIALSTESLAKLSDEYLKLKPGAERATFLIDTFGRSGLEMGKLLDKGSVAILKMAASIEDNLIMTQKGVDEARQYEIAMDDLEDAAKGLGYTFGNVVIPPLVEVAKTLKYDIGFIQDTSKNINTLNSMSRNFRAEALGITTVTTDAGKSLKDMAKYTGDANRALNWMNDATEAGTEAMDDYAKAVSDAYTLQLGLIDRIQSEEESYASRVRTLADERKKIERDKADAIAQGGDEAMAKVQEFDEALAKNSQAARDNAAEHEKAGRRIVYDLLQQMLSADGLTTTEMNLLLKRGEGWGLYSHKVVEEAQAILKEANDIKEGIDNIPASKKTDMFVEATQARNELGRVSSALSWIPSYKPTLMFVEATQARSVLRDLSSALSWIPSYKTTRIDITTYKYEYLIENRIIRGRGAGGHVAAGETVAVGERGVELFKPDMGGTVIPNNAIIGAGLSSGRSGGNSGTVNIYLNGAIIDPQEAAMQLLPTLEHGLRALGVSIGQVG